MNPDERKILVYGFENEDYMEYTFSDLVKSGIYDDMEIDFSQLNLYENENLVSYHIEFE